MSEWIDINNAFFRREVRERSGRPTIVYLYCCNQDFADFIDSAVKNIHSVFCVVLLLRVNIA